MEYGQHGQSRKVNCQTMVCSFLEAKIQVHVWSLEKQFRLNFKRAEKMKGETELLLQLFGI